MPHLAPYTHGWLSHNPEPSAIQRLDWSMERAVLRSPIQFSLEEVRPVIHLAHRLRLAVKVPSRIIVDHELLLVLEGEGELELAGAKRRVFPGDLYVIEPFVPHSLESESTGFEHIAVHFDLTPELRRVGELLSREPYQITFPEGFGWSPYVQLGPTDPIREQLEQLIRFWAEHTPLSRLKSEGLLMNVVTHLIRTRPLSCEHQASQIDVRIKSALRQIELRFPEQVRSADLALAAGLGISHFNRLFRECMQQTPAAYVRSLRLQHARSLVEHGVDPIKVIAFASGFTNSAHFSRAFFTLHGVWPSELRRRAMDGQGPFSSGKE